MKRALWSICAGALALGVAGVASAADDPSLTYWTLESEHFRVTYPHTMEAIATRMIAHSEGIYERLTPAMQYVPEEKTVVLLTDTTDQANGSATPIPYNTIRLFVTSPEDLSALGDYDDWYLGLMTHEYTHILHTGNISGLAAVANRIIGRQLSPNSAQPRWIIEGLAVVYESDYTAGGRIRSSLFDTFLRADVLADNIASLDQISSGANRWPYGNLYYLYGSRFMRWMADLYGPDVFSAISADYGATTIPFGINRAMFRRTGSTYEDLYEGWTAHLVTHYREQVERVKARGLREGRPLTHHGGNVAYPRFIPRTDVEAAGSPRDRLIYYRDDLRNRAGLYELSLGPAAEVLRDELVIRTGAESSVGFSPDGHRVFNDQAYHQNYYYRNDLFDLGPGDDSTFGTEPARARLTEGARVLHPDVSPDGKSLVFTRNSLGTSKLMMADRRDDGELSNLRVLVANQPYEQAYTPRFSPDGKTVAWSAWSEGGYRDIRLLDLSTGAVRDLTHDRSLDLHPVFSADGRYLYFSSDRSGIFNLYRLELATGALRMVTNVTGAAVMPALSPDGGSIVYVGYTHEGYDLFRIELDEARFLEPPPPPEDRPPPAQKPEPVVYEKSRYNPLIYLRPRAYSFDVGLGNYGKTAMTISASLSDLIEHHFASVSLRGDPGAPEPRVDVGYSYGGLPLDLGVSFTRAPIPRERGYSLGKGSIPYHELATSGSARVGLTLRHPYVSQSISLSYNATYLEPDLEGLHPLDPLGPTPQRPSSSFLSEFGLGYTLSTIEGSAKTVGGAARGLSLRLSFSVADPNTGSSESYYSVDASSSSYIPMPWPGDQTLALRGAVGVTAGTYGGAYRVGGYDLVSNGPIETLFQGVYDRSFVLRGYLPGAFSGPQYFQSSFEYRAPLGSPNWGPGTLPIFLRRIDATAFCDWGGAFERFDPDLIRFFANDHLIDTPQLATSVGGEIGLGTTLAYRLPTDFKVGYAYGFDPGRVEGGQLYFLSSGSF